MAARRCDAAAAALLRAAACLFCVVGPAAGQYQRTVEVATEAALTAAYTEDMVCDGRPRCEAVCWRWHGMFGCADVVELLLLLLLLLQQRPRRPRLRSGCIRSASVSMRSTPG